MVTLALLAGLWITDCTQTQFNSRAGWVKDSYTISEAGDYTYQRQWHTDAACEKNSDTVVEEGSIKLGGSLNSFFNKTAVKADFTSAAGTDLGGVDIENGIVLKVARNLKNGTSRNTMLGIIGFKKQ